VESSPAIKDERKDRSAALKTPWSSPRKFFGNYRTWKGKGGGKNKGKNKSKTKGKK
jgi:hypothetical protein